MTSILFNRTGKTFSMLNIVDFCHRSGWIVAHVPNGLFFSRRKHLKFILFQH
jgi:hypothetical protein